MKLFFLLAAATLVPSTTAVADVALFLGQEYQAQAGSNAGTIRGGGPDSDAAFTSFLSSALLTSADVLIADNCASAADGTYATWGKIAQNQTSIDMGASTANVTVAGWDSANDVLAAGPSGNATLAWSYNDSNELQSGAPRPSFASGSGSGYGIRTNSGSTSDGILNAVQFDFTTPISAFGVFGGDLETGGPGSPVGFLFVEFADGSTERIDYDPDSSLFPDATFSGTGNNTSETYGNETGRFVGIADDGRLITSATFVVGDDDQNDDADSEQLSFIAPITFTDVSGGTCVNHVPTAVASVPEPSSLSLIALGLGGLLARRRRS